MCVKPAITTFHPQASRDTRVEPGRALISFSEKKEDGLPWNAPFPISVRFNPPGYLLHTSTERRPRHQQLKRQRTTSDNWNYGTRGIDKHQVQHRISLQIFFTAARATSTPDRTEKQPLQNKTAIKSVWCMYLPQFTAINVQGQLKITQAGSEVHYGGPASTKLQTPRPP